MGKNKGILLLLMAVVCVGAGCREKVEPVDYRTAVETKNQEKNEEQEGTEAKVLTIDGVVFDLEESFEEEALKKVTEKNYPYLRNGVYAKYGYKFAADELVRYYSQYKWYKGQYYEVEEQFTELDWNNLKKIKRLEEKKTGALKSSEYDIKLELGTEKELTLNGETYLLQVIEDPDYEEEGNKPVRFTIKMGEQSVVYERAWNDGISIAVADFFTSDNRIDIYVTALGTDSESNTTVYTFDGQKIEKYLEIAHFLHTFIYDGNGKIYYWYGENYDIGTYNMYTDYRTKAVVPVTDPATAKALKDYEKQKK